MSRDIHHRVASSTITITDLAQEIVPQNGNNGVPPNNDASPAIVQCLLIAARRGRQIRLAREQAVQLQQSEPRSVIEEAPESDET